MKKSFEKKMSLKSRLNKSSKDHIEFQQDRLTHEKHKKKYIIVISVMAFFTVVILGLLTFMFLWDGRDGDVDLDANNVRVTPLPDIV